MIIGQTYNPLKLEEQWYDFWVERGFFKADEHSDKPPYTIVIPPPNVTGSLHMGHALFVTLQDILIRFKRMQGFEALWLPGTDHAGIATQVVVERLLKQEGTGRRELGRAKFLERVWQWKEQSGGRIVEQLKRLGASCDWDRERFTMDEDLNRAVRHIFVQMYGDGLIFRGPRMVNWDPATQTVLSDLEVTNEDERGTFWTLKYPLADQGGCIMVGTTRPETMLGDTAVAVHPEDERYQHLIGQMVELPIVGRKIPIIADTILPDPDKGTGAVKVTPAHDPNDFACGERNDLALIQVIGLDATIINERGDIPEEFVGLDRYEARQLVVRRFDEAGLLEGVEEIQYSPGRSERSGVVVEPLVLDQWFVDGERFAKPALDAVKQGKTRIIPEVWTKTYYHFMENPRDWCISRQLWWGHQIPAWYGPEGDHFVAMTHHEALEQARQKYGRDVELTQDPDVLDTWFSSGLWPFSTMGWPDETVTLEKFYPTSVLETGSDILFFWVARMMMMGIYAMGEVPFRDVFLHAMVRDEKGKKMSKVTGNVIDPLHMIHGAAIEDLDAQVHKELITKIRKDQLTLEREDTEVEGIREQGADALRFTLAILAAQARDIKLDISRMEGYRAFLNKLWNAAQFVLRGLGEEFTASAYATYTSSWADEGAPFDLEDLSDADRWMLSRLDHTIGAVTAALEEYKFNDAAQSVYDFVWHEYCDWYIELIKDLWYDDSGEREAQREATRQVAVYGLEAILRLLHPVSPFITEDIWQSMPKGEGAPAALIVAPWPEQREASRWVEASETIELAKGLITAVRSVRGETNVKPSVSIPRAYLTAPHQTHAALSSTQAYVLKLAKIHALEVVAPGETPDIGPCATSVFGGVHVQIPLKGLIDVAAERDRLRKEIDRVDGDLAHVSKKLGNPKFVERAPDHVVQKDRDKLAAFDAEREALLASMDELKALE
ncbi:MAG: valine--tRNA ligase [Myxococcota bacterium]